MINIGLLGEDPNDTSSIKNLLNQKYHGKVQFYPLANRINGYQLDNPKIKRSLPIEFEAKSCDFIIYIRDLDGLKSDQSKINERLKWFHELDKTINNKGILLLNIWELEGLILADIDTFNKLYHITYKFKKDPMAVKEPKELLKHITSKSKKKYHESDCPEIFEKLSIDTIENGCSYFKEFLLEFNERSNK
jgi:Domain of unknown function (DUF4276)